MYTDVHVSARQDSDTAFDLFAGSVAAAIVIVVIFVVV